MRSPLASLFFIIGLPLLIAIAIFTTQLQTNISAFVTAGDNAEEILLASEIQSGTLSRRYILSVDAGEGKQVSNLFIQAWKQKLKAISGVSDVWLTNETRDVFASLSKVYAQHGAQLYSRQPEQDLKAIFSEQSLKIRATNLKTALLSPQGQGVKKILAKDPLLLSLSGFKHMAKQYQKNSIEHSRYANFILESEMSGMAVAEQIQIQTVIKNTFNHQAEQQGFNYLFAMTGVPLFAAATQSMIEADIKLISILSTIALALLFVYLFHSFRAMFWVFSLLMTVMACAVIVTNLIFGSVHGMTLAVGSTLIGICIDYPIHALVHAQGMNENERLAMIKQIFPSLLMGGLTTLIGYIALGFSGYPGFQQVAVYSGTGIIVSLLLTRFLFPRLMKSKTKAVVPFKFISFWPLFCQKYRIGLLSIVLVLSVVSVIQLDRLQWMQDLQQLTPELDYLKIQDKEIRQRIVSMEPGRFVLVSADNVEQLLQRAEQIYTQLDQLKSKGELENYFGLYPWVLSEHQQRENQKQLLAALTVQQREFWRQALQSEGLSIKKLGNLDYTQEKVLTVKQVLATPIAKILSNQLILTEQQNLLIIWLSMHNVEAVQQVLANQPRVQYFSQRDLLNRMAVDYQQRAEITLMAGLAFITFLLWLRYKSLLVTLQTLAPAVLAALLILALWAWTGEAISFLHLVGFLLAVAICVDYGIFYQENRSGHIVLTYQAMATSMLTSALVFGCLLFAETSMLQVLAKVVSCGIALGFLLCPIFIKTNSLTSPINK